MTKTQLIETIATATGLDKKAVGGVLASLVLTVEEQLKKGEAVTVPDLAKFSVKEKAATPERQGVNPFTKAPITIAAKPESRKVTVKPVAGLKKALS